MLTVLMGRAKTGKTETVLRRVAELRDDGRQILLVPEHASHQAEIDLCRACGPTASRHAEVLSFRRLSDRVLSIAGGIAQVTLDAGGRLLRGRQALGGGAAQPGFDQRDRMSKLADHLEESEYVLGKDVFLDGFTYFNGQERRVLAVLLRQARSVTVTLLGEPDSREEIFEASLKTLGQLRRLCGEERCPMEVQTLRREGSGALGQLQR